MAVSSQTLRESMSRAISKTLVNSNTKKHELISSANSLTANFHFLSHDAKVSLFKHIAAYFMGHRLGIPYLIDNCLSLKLLGTGLPEQCSMSPSRPEAT